MSEWQPIETAPRDGSFVLLWLKRPFSEIRMARWYAPWGTWLDELPQSCENEQYGIGVRVPSHWMPLPEPPK